MLKKFEGEGYTFMDQVKDGLIKVYGDYRGSPTLKHVLFEAFEEVFNVKIQEK